MNEIVKTNQPITVEMVTLEGKVSTRMYQYVIDKFSNLGREIKISPKANVSVNKKGFKTEFYVETINVVIGIGRDHTADLIMSVEAWEALNKGEEIKITTAKEFRENYL
jgi:hypothetical protein